MFNGKGIKDYSQVSLDDFSDDDDSHHNRRGGGGGGDEEDFVQQGIRTQQVRWPTRTGRTERRTMGGRMTLW